MINTHLYNIKLYVSPLLTDGSQGSANDCVIVEYLWQQTRPATQVRPKNTTPLIDRDVLMPSYHVRTWGRPEISLIVSGWRCLTSAKLAQRDMSWFREICRQSTNTPSGDLPGSRWPRLDGRRFWSGVFLSRQIDRPLPAYGEVVCIMAIALDCDGDRTVNEVLLQYF